LLKNYYFYLVWRDKFQPIDDLMVRRVMELKREKCSLEPTALYFSRKVEDEKEIDAQGRIKKIKYLN
jgi:hypothetical protein